MTVREAALYVTLRRFKSLLDRTNAFIADALSQVQNPYVACSFGKDSGVMLDLIRHHRPGIPVRFVRWQGETELMNNFDEVIEAWYSRHPELNLSQVQLSRQTVDDRVAERYETEAHDSYFVGLRAEESTGRRISIKTLGTIYPLRGGLTRIVPLAWWSLDDVVAFTVANDLPVLETYRRDGFDTRTTSRVPRGAFGIRANFLQNLRQRDLSAYNKLLHRFPELATHG